MKKIIRKEIIRKRDEIPVDVRFRKDAIIKNKLFTIPEFSSAKTVLFYASFRSEADTAGMIEGSLQAGKKVALPRVDKEKHFLMLYEIKDPGELSPGYMGIPEPLVPDDRLITIDEIDVIIIPGVAFDCSGNRLGYGAGYYDNLLSKRKKKIPVIAPAYEEQLIYSIPVEVHDVKVDVIVTDKRVVKIKTWE
jgi:5-formyltetrahydrofolate cyclo-ligase